MALGLGCCRRREKPSSIGDKGFDLASIVEILGGLFLIYKTVKEIHAKLEGEDPNVDTKSKRTFLTAGRRPDHADRRGVFDSVITAGGTAKHVGDHDRGGGSGHDRDVSFSPVISSFVHKHPTTKMLALSFLVMIGLSLGDRRMDP